MDDPRWMAEAWRMLGKKEMRGEADNEEIVGLFRDVGRADVTSDDVPWCAAYVGACLKRAGHEGTGSLRARSYLEWGEVLSEPRIGAITVLSRGNNPDAGHVGFWIGETAEGPVLLGGNQSDQVSVAPFAKSRLLGYRWPREVSSLPSVTSRGAGLTFDKALVQVLAMEGGFTADPDDPGGPTNKGITLEVFSRHTGRKLDPATRATRVRELRAISDDLVREIYLQRYWRPSRASEMPAAIGFMHFDASVNHGLTGAARLLQGALTRQQPSLDVDGEIGPLTLGAAARADERRLLADFANERRARYRALPHFWKFGRGWLNRVDQTEARARMLMTEAEFTPVTSKPSTKGTTMTNTTGTGMPGKWWGQSMTIWGALLTALSTVVPVIGPAIGLDLTPDLVREAGEQLVSVVQAIGGLVGTLMTIYGRARANQTLALNRA